MTTTFKNDPIKNKLLETRDFPTPQGFNHKFLNGDGYPDQFSIYVSSRLCRKIFYGDKIEWSELFWLLTFFLFGGVLQVLHAVACRLFFFVWNWIWLMVSDFREKDYKHWLKGKALSCKEICQFDEMISDDGRWRVLYPEGFISVLLISSGTY